MAATHRAYAVWHGDLASGNGRVSGVTSQSFSYLPVSRASRTELPAGLTSPEELVAAAHATCLCRALSHGLGEAGIPPERLQTSAAVTLDNVDVGWEVVSSVLTVPGKVRGIYQARLQQVAAAAKDGCPIPLSLKGNIDLSVEATLES